MRLLAILALLAALAFSLMLVRSAQATAPTVEWVDWTSTTSTSVTGSLGGGAVTVTHNGPRNNFFNSGDIWFPVSAYVSSTVHNKPPPEHIRLGTESEGATHTITFSSPVTNPVVAVFSLGNPFGQNDSPPTPGNPLTYDFSTTTATLSILSSNSGPCGIYICSLVIDPVGSNVLVGIEGSGVVQFTGTVSSITWTVTGAEFWNGFTVGVPIPPDSDGDGVGDNSDACLNTPAGLSTNSDGCALIKMTGGGHVDTGQGDHSHSFGFNIKYVGSNWVVNFEYNDNHAGKPNGRNPKKNNAPLQYHANAATSTAAVIQGDSLVVSVPCEKRKLDANGNVRISTVVCALHVADKQEPGKGEDKFLLTTDETPFGYTSKIVLDGDILIRGNIQAHYEEQDE